MSLDISTKAIKPVRLTYDQVARRIGENKAGSRYQEATYDIQPTTNFHYRPLWDPRYEVFDTSRTAIVMQDWYAFHDPRQYYYGTYTMARAKQQEVAEKNFSFVEKRGLLDTAPHIVKQKVRDFFTPLRHVEWGANMNNCFITDTGYGTAITQVTMFNSIDRLGIAQYLTRLCLLVDENETTGIDKAKEDWLSRDIWQELRHVVEDIFVIEDWFETMVAQNIVMDGLIYPLIYDRLAGEMMHEGGSAIVMLTEFMNEWQQETVRWTNALVKVTAQESDANKDLLSQWVAHWSDRITEALKPISAEAFSGDGELFVQEVKQDLLERLSKQGLKV